MDTVIDPASAGASKNVSHMVDIRGVRKYFGSTEVLKGITMTVREGEVLCLLGPSGSGKSTLLRCINRLEKYDAGRIYVKGELVGYRERDGRLYDLTENELAARRREIGMVFQRFNLFPHMTVLENVMEAPLHVLRQRPDKVRARAVASLERVGLGSHVEHYPAQISGGQQQRVAIARALMMDPKLMLFDEPTSALDPELTGEVLDVMRDLARSGMTMIVVTHEIQFAQEVADSVVFMADGIVVEEGDPKTVLSASKSERMRMFLSRSDEFGGESSRED